MKKMNKIDNLYAVYEKSPAHGSKEHNIILAPFKTKEEAEQSRIKYGYNTDNYYVDIFENEYPKRSYICTHPSPKMDNIKEQIDKIDKIDKIRNSYQPKQRTSEWYEYRHNLITASSVHKLLSSPSLLNSVIYEKCKPITVHNTNYYVKNSRQWGNIYEPLSIKIYEQLFHTTVEDFGCIQHPKYSFLGASPDGINTDLNSDRYGRMVEVKNIYNRDITGIPKDDYWVQMQIQMETCDLNECDFIETRFIEFPSENEFYDNEQKEWKGVILCFIKKNVNSEENSFYEYLPLDVPLDKSTIDLWITNCHEQWKDTHTLYSKHYWYLDEFSCILVLRNTHWFMAALPKIENTWKIIEVEKKIGYEHRAAKKRSPINDMYSIKIDNDDNTHVIHNLHVNTKLGICLVKLDSA